VQEAWATAVEGGALNIDHRLWHVQTSEYKSVRLRASPVRDEAGQPIEWYGTATDVNELVVLQQRQAILLHELQHRVRNILALVRSIANRTAQSSSTVQEYEDNLNGRILAMARTQNVLTSEPGARLSLEDLFRSELAAHGIETGERVDISGPGIALTGKAAESLSLAIHELATNAAKYGSFSSDDGKLAISWQIRKGDPGEVITIFWIESGLSIEPPSRRGFGSELIEKLVPYEFGGTGRLEFRSDGLKCEIEVPLSEDVRLERNGEKQDESG
jgi:two-component system CheB/CheR fusion protein